MLRIISSCRRKLKPDWISAHFIDPTSKMESSSWNGFSADVLPIPILLKKNEQRWPISIIFINTEFIKNLFLLLHHFVQLRRSFSSTAFDSPLWENWFRFSEIINQEANWFTFLKQGSSTFHDCQKMSSSKLTSNLPFAVEMKFFLWFTQVFHNLPLL